MTAEFQPKGEETLKIEVLEDLGLDAYEGNEEVVDRVVARRKVDEDFKASVHNQKKEHQTKAEKRAELLKKAGYDPETGEKLQTNVVEPKESKSDSLTFKDVIAARDLHEADVDFVMSEAKLRNLSFAEAKAMPYIQNTLKIMAEERQTATATQTKTTGRSFSQNSVDRIMENFEQGIVPDDPEEFAKAQHAFQKKQKR